MALIKLSALSAQILASTDAAVATAIGGAVTTANVTALRELLTNLGNRKDLLFPILKISSLADDQFQPE